MGDRWPVVELRQYTLHPGQRDVLIELFDRALLEPQEAVGMQVLGQFRDLDRPDRFVWLRAFPDMESRRASLEAFYGGPVWRTHRAAANATMIDSDDVLLLRPATPTSGFGVVPPRPGVADRIAAGTFVVTISSLDAPVEVGELEEKLLPGLAATTAPVLAILIEEPSENTFPALPVRTGGHVVVWVQRTSVDVESQQAAMHASTELAKTGLPHLVADPLQLRLEPTSRSRLR